MRVYQDVSADEAVQAALSQDRDRLFALLAQRAADLPPTTGHAWRDHLLDRITYAENPWTLDAERRGEIACDGWLAAAAAQDLRELQRLYDLDLPGLGAPWGAGALPPIAACLAAADDWTACLPELARHHRENGCGAFARCTAFRWQGGRLEPITHPDPSPLEALIGYEEQRQAVIRNTKDFLAGLPAQDVLLYGDRGTGKSSTVKGLLGAFAPSGLRLVEVDRHAFRDFSRVAAAVRGRRQRFILFFDDLSFEAEETEYKDLKAVLEGGVEARPENLLVYATSNRRHLVREEFADRDSGPHGDDILEEKLSLADRFGLTVIYPAPDQEAYLAIVEGLARLRGVRLAPDDLRQRALRWEMWGNGRSGRTARQLVDALAAEVGRPAGL